MLLQFLLQGFVCVVFIDVCIQNFFGFHVNVSVLSQGLKQSTFLHGGQFLDYFFKCFLGKVSSTGQREAFLDFEIIDDLRTVNFLKIFFYLDILVALQDLVHAF